MDTQSLSTPVQHNYNDPTVERDVKRLRVWLTNMPLLDVVKTLRLVQGALNSLNEQKLEPAKRYQLLEVFRYTTERLFITVDPIYMRQLNLSKSQRELSAVGIEQLLLAMAGGYKILVKALYEPATHGQSADLFGLAINRAIEQLGYVLLDNYRCYRTVPESLFSELHQLYRYARHFGLLAVTAADEDTGQSPGIAESYHAIMLLSLTDPFRLAEGEVGLLYDILKQHAGQCRVTPGSHWPGDPDGLFLLDLGSDAPPRLCAQSGQSVEDVREPYLLDAREALNAIRKRLEQSPIKVRMQSPEAVLLRHLLPGDAIANQNRESRRPDNRSTSLFNGLDAIHAFLLAAIPAGQEVAEGTSDGEIAKPLPCRIVDTSEHGMRLARDDGRTGDARVGDLLGIVEDGLRLQLVIIRSVEIHRETGMELGVQKINGSCGPVYCRSQTGDEAEELRAVFIPSSEADGISATLVMATGFYEAGRRLLVNSFGRKVNVRAGRNVSDSPVFDRFEFTADDSLDVKVIS
jgi:cyclic-di-GMP-binding protein